MSNKNASQVLEIRFDRFWMREGAPMPPCYVCDKPTVAWPWPEGHADTAYGYASINNIEDRERGVLVPLCEACFVSNRSASDPIVRKFFREFGLTAMRKE
jgi:hypothetical protein